MLTKRRITRMPGCHYRCPDWKQMEIAYHKKSAGTTLAVQRT